MVCRTLSALALAVSVAGCADDVVKERPVTRTGTSNMPSAAAASGTAGASTVCAAYRRQLRVVRLRLRMTAASGSEALRHREAALEALITDACE